MTFEQMLEAMRECCRGDVVRVPSPFFIDGDAARNAIETLRIRALVCLALTEEKLNPLEQIGVRVLHAIASLD